MNSSERTIWAAEKIEDIRIKTSHYSALEKRNIRQSFLRNAIEIIACKEDLDELEWKEFQQKVIEIIAVLPTKKDHGKLSYGQSLKLIGRFKTYMQKKFNYVSKGFYLKIWVVIGVVLGSVMGLILGYWLPGILLGIGIGLVVGSLQDNKAAAKNRVL